MEQSEGNWGARLTDQIGRRIERFRKLATNDRGRAMSVQMLADRCTELGYPLDRSVLAKLEKGLRQNITVAELLAIARALNVPPIVLLFPIEDAETFEVLPGTDVDAWLAMRWFTGESPFPSPRDDATVPVDEQARWMSWHRDPTGLLSYRRHESYLIAWTRFRARAQAALNDASVPDIPEEMRRAHMARARDADHSAFACEQALCQERLELRARGLRLPQLPGELEYLDELESPEEFLALSIDAAHRIHDPRGGSPFAASADS